VTSDMQRLRKTLTYLLTYLPGQTQMNTCRHLFWQQSTL